jgi:glyoxylase-like metal-dependent hydrolase (beta-lactamase superfamily II)
LVIDEVPFGSGIKVISTPGHASHHQCFVFDDYFFAGELFGAHIPMENNLYLRPATPHRFILEDYLGSMELIKPYLDKSVCFAHYGSFDNGFEVLCSAKKQLKLWVKLIEENRDASMEELIEIMLNNDETLDGFSNLGLYMQARERHFTINSIDGILKYLDAKKQEIQ